MAASAPAKVPVQETAESAQRADEVRAAAVWLAANDALPVLDEPDEGTLLEAAPPFGATDDLEELSRLGRKQRLHDAALRDERTTVTSSELGQRLALRVLRDSLSLQLARRGFDGLRSSAMNMLTELTADFVRSIGTELQHALPTEPAEPNAIAPLVPLVVRTQQLVNMRSTAEWRQAQDLYQRQVRRHESAHPSPPCHRARRLAHTRAPVCLTWPLRSWSRYTARPRS